MALRAAQRIAHKLHTLQPQPPAAALDRCLIGAVQTQALSGAGVQGKTAGAAVVGALWPRCLHGTAPLLAEHGKDDVDAANQELAAFFGLQPAEPPQPDSSPSGPTEGTSSGAAAAAAAGSSSRGRRTDAAAAASQASGTLNVRKEEPKPMASPAVARAKPTPSGRLTHVDKDGRAAMVDVGKKLNTQREAVASAKVLLGPEVYQLVASNSIKKGDVLTVAELAGIMGAKHTSLLIPLCHNISLTYVDVKLKLLEEEHAVSVIAEVRTVGPTGVEMEALTAASTAALTIYDMCKAVSRRLVISQVVLESKHGGKSGTYIRGGEDKSGP